MDIYKSKYILLSVENLIYSVVIILTILVLSNVIKRYLIVKNNKISNKQIALFLFKIIKIVLWVSCFGIIASIILIDITKIILIKNKYILITTADLVLIIFIPVVAVLLVRIAELLLHNKKLSAKRKEVRRKVMNLLRYIIILIVLNYIQKIIMVNPTLITSFELFNVTGVSITVYDIFYIGVIIAVTGLSSLAIKRFFRLRMTHKKMDMGTGESIFQIIKYILWIIAIVVILQSSGFNISILLAGSAALLVGLGMGLQYLFADVISGIILLVERPLKVSDVIQVNKTVGRVQHIGVRTTTVITREDITMLIPNSRFTKYEIINWSNINNKTRFEIEVGVAYGSDVELVMKILHESAISHDNVVLDPKPFVRFTNFGNSSLDFKLFFWSYEDLRIDNVKSDIRIYINRKFKEHNITIPFPQRDIHIIQN